MYRMLYCCGAVQARVFWGVAFACLRPDEDGNVRAVLFRSRGECVVSKLRVLLLVYHFVPCHLTACGEPMGR